MSTFTIAGEDFYQYVAYRLKKDGLGFLPASRWGEGSTDVKTFIKAVVPQNAYDFLVYAHELGHCKSEQKLPASGLMFMYDQTSPESLSNEYNAWVWAFRYLKKLGISYTKEELTEALQKSFKSYTRGTKYLKQANFYIEKLNKMLGINLAFEEEVTLKSPVTRINISESTTFRWLDVDWQPVLHRADEATYWMPVLENKPKKVKGTITPSSTNKKHKTLDGLDGQEA